ncbi:uncharacterized protein N7473_009660, partial [Penicillium subrubescens]|uniref:uncharacterized protein n=1 Tax=Penicillium subrubescens TaxID=1316194 RepID=UPI002544E251
KHTRTYRTNIKEACISRANGKNDKKVTTKDQVQAAIENYIADLAQPLRALNQQIFETPELAYKESNAHERICNFLESLDIPVTRHAYGLSTAFEATAKAGNDSGRCVNFNAEYDALPDLGHACGHNLIATASVTGFVALAYVIGKFGLPGQAQLLGTPAEEDGGGKIDLIRAGAYGNVDASLMVNPMAEEEFAKDQVIGIAGRSSISCYDIIATYHGVSAHAAANPWEGRNALDALVMAYNVTNAIPELTCTKYTIRSRTMNGARTLGERVRKCLEAGAFATGCTVEVEESQIYADLVVNPPLCESFQECMKNLGEPILARDELLMTGSTDQGNVSQIVPALHGLIGIPVLDGAKCHTRQFTAAAGTDQAHQRMITAGKAMAMTGWRLLVDDEFYGMAASHLPKRWTVDSFIQSGI